MRRSLEVCRSVCAISSLSSLFLSLLSHLCSCLSPLLSSLISRLSSLFLSLAGPSAPMVCHAAVVHLVSLTQCSAADWWSHLSALLSALISALCSPLSSLLLSLISYLCSCLSSSSISPSLLSHLFSHLSPLLSAPTSRGLSGRAAGTCHTTCASCCHTKEMINAVQSTLHAISLILPHAVLHHLRLVLPHQRDDQRCPTHLAGDLFDRAAGTCYTTCAAECDCTALSCTIEVPGAGGTASLLDQGKLIFDYAYNKSWNTDYCQVHGRRPSPPSAGPATPPHAAHCKRRL